MAILQDYVFVLTQGIYSVELSGLQGWPKPKGDQLDYTRSIRWSDNVCVPLDLGKNKIFSIIFFFNSDMYISLFFTLRVCPQPATKHCARRPPPRLRLSQKDPHPELTSRILSITMNLAKTRRLMHQFQ